MDFYETIEKRRSIRKYDKTKSVPEKSLDRILKAGRLAPTAANRQPYKIYIIKKPAEKLAFIHQKYVLDAPIALAIFVKSSDAWIRKYDQENFAFVDGAIVFEHIILAATAEGLGTVWIANINPEEIKNALQVPDDYQFLALTPIGYPAEYPDPRPRKPEEDLFTNQ